MFAGFALFHAHPLQSQLKREGLTPIPACLILNSQMKHEKSSPEQLDTPVREAVYLAVAALLVILSLSWTCSAEASLSGEWSSMIALEPATGIWSTETDFTVEMEFDDWIVEARSVFEDNVWKKQEFEAKVQLGNFDIESDLRFEPYKDRFRDWITKLEWESEELAFTLTTKLTRTIDWLIFEVEREWDTVKIDTSFQLRASSGGCAFVFSDADLDIEFDWCGVETDLEISFDDDGFDEFVIEFSELSSERIPWFTFDLEFTRTAEKTVVKLSPDIVLESPWCAGTLDLELEGDLPNEPNPFPISITEVSLTWEIGEWEIEATAVLDPDDWIADLYWLEVKAEGTFDLDTCGEVSLGLMFLWTETMLGRTRFVTTYEPGDMLSIAIDGDIDLDAGQLDRLALELQIEW